MDAEPEPATFEELDGYLQRRFPCQSWTALDARPDGSVFFRCECGAATGWYSSDEAGAAALDAHLDGGEAAKEAYLIDWLARHEEQGTRPAPTAASQTSLPEPPTQCGLIEMILRHGQLIGALDVSIDDLARTLQLTLERSFNDESGCDVACLEAAGDAFTLVHWDPAHQVEVYSDVGPFDDARQSNVALQRFLGLANLTWAEVHYPPRIPAERP